MNSLQTQALEICCKKGENLFLTGAAGTGKSWTLCKIIQMLRAAGKNVIPTAPTGIAACAIAGSTIHHTFGITRNQSISPKASSIWPTIDVLVIDEVSMLSGSMLKLLESVARRYRKSAAVFGGIQVIFCGDFFQLPPVFGPAESKDTELAFETELWYEIFQTSQICLTEIYRQENKAFMQFLNGIRIGEVDTDYIQSLPQSLSGEQEKLSTYIAAINETVTKRNEKYLQTLPGAVHAFEAFILVQKCPSGSDRLALQTRAKQEFQYRNVVQLKRGAVVMLTANLSVEQGLANGAKGTVEDFCPQTGFPICQIFPGGKNKDPIRFTVRPHQFELTNTKLFRVVAAQLPLQLAHAMTVHKSQGQSIDNVIIDCSKIFAFGHAYTAFSRAINPANLVITHFRESVVRTDPKVLKFYAEMMKWNKRHMSVSV